MRHRQGWVGLTLMVATAACGASPQPQVPVRPPAVSAAGTEATLGQHQQSRASQPVVAVPPQQARPWSPQHIPSSVVSALGPLFDAGLPDPRGCTYGSARVAAPNGRNVMRHGWLFARAQERWLISHDGTVLRVIGESLPADLAADVEAAEHSFSKPLSWVSVALMLRAGHIKEAERLIIRWRKSIALKPSRVTDKPFPLRDQERANLVEHWLSERYGTSLIALQRGHHDELKERLEQLETAIRKSRGQLSPNSTLMTTLPAHIALARRAAATPLQAEDTLVGKLQRLPEKARTHRPSTKLRREVMHDLDGLLALALDDGGRFTRQIGDVGGLDHDHLVAVAELAIELAYNEVEIRGIHNEVDSSDISNFMSDPVKRKAAATALRRAFAAAGKPADRIANAANTLKRPSSDAAQLRTSAMALQQLYDDGRPLMTRGHALTAPLLKRLNDTQHDPHTHCVLARALVRWSPSEHAAAQQALGRSLRDAPSSETAACAGRLTLDLARRGEVAAIEHWQRAFRKHFRKLPSWARHMKSHLLMAWMSPLWELPLNPRVKAVAHRIFAAGSPWLPAPSMARGETVLNDLLSKRRLYLHEPFRKHVMAALADTKLIGTLSTSRRQFDIRIGEMNYGSDVTDASFPKQPTERQMRMMDMVGYEMSQVGDRFDYRAYWPKAQRDKALAKMFERIRNHDWP